MQPTTVYLTDMEDNVFCCKYASPIGEILIAADFEAVTGLWFEGQKYFGAGLGDVLFVSPESHEPLKLAVCWLEKYFSGKKPETLPQLKPRGTEFQKKVWDALRDIPYGSTVSYAHIAEEIDCKSPRAVGSAVGRNPISILIPCHRVIGSGGNLTGYAGGIERKIFLLQLENPQMPH